MGYYLWGHTGSGDHADEDRIRGSCRLLAAPPALVSSNPEEELRYGLGELAGIHDRLPTPDSGSYCLTHRTDAADYLRKAGTRAVLWGWSGAGMSRQLAKALSRFDTLVVSERQSLSALWDAGLTKKTRLGPDLSFLVERQLRPLQGGFRTDTVGLCLSADAARLEQEEGLLFHSYQRLIRYIMAETSFQVALIPYCARRGRNDTLLHIALERQFRGWGRVFCRKDGSCRVLRGDISLCRCVVGGAGAVAAWSCGVPALCIGATPRATGLAKELHSAWEDAVVPVSALREPEELTRRFRRFLRKEDRLRRELDAAVPLRRQQALAWSWED
jgi:hypothetical protein